MFLTVEVVWGRCRIQGACIKLDYILSGPEMAIFKNTSKFSSPLPLKTGRGPNMSNWTAGLVPTLCYLDTSNNGDSEDIGDLAWDEIG